MSTSCMVGAVGIEFAVNSLSPADSITLAPLLPLEMQLADGILCPRCAQVFASILWRGCL